MGAGALELMAGRREHRVSDHYSGHDPATGCALMMVGAITGGIGFILGLILG